MRFRDKLFHHYKETGSSEDFSYYKLFRNRVVNLLKSSKISYFQNYLAENKNNMKILWKWIRSVIKIKSIDINPIPKLIDEKGIKITDPIYYYC